MSFWEQIAERLKRAEQLVLLYVLESTGSSPGRQGFKMMVSDAGDWSGSIGGGIMEHKLVTLSLSLLQKGGFEPFLKRQIHRSSAPSDRSGMICSGEQTVGFYWLTPNDLSLIESIIAASGSGETAALVLTEKGLFCQFISTDNPDFLFKEEDALQWTYTERLGVRDKIFIVGGGHVGKALSAVMHRLGFYVVVLDEREQLTTMEDNAFANEKKVIAYNQLETRIEEGEHSYVVLMSFGYVTDGICIRRILGRTYRYLGMMGSKEKVATLFAELEAEGFDKAVLNEIKAPIGIPIHSQTPEEIAVSIAAEIISVKNGGQ